ncbi:spore germination protein [Paenibacillus motobuensis]|uniref:Spore germination protein n=1 Tax=Paenibacillus motobuensis TaxID=295324 RepID=A0ABN0YBF4_9BACL
MSEHHMQTSVWTKQKLSDLFNKSSDVILQSFHFKDENTTCEIMLIYSGGLCDGAEIVHTVLPELDQMFGRDHFHNLLMEGATGALPLICFNKEISQEEIVELVFEGNLLISFTDTNDLFKLNISNIPERSPEESSTEISIKGPKDGFVEAYAKNIALIRKRIRSTSLCCETIMVGKRTRTKVTMMYIDDILSPRILEELKNRIQKIDVDGLFSINQLEEALSDTKYPIFPLLDSTGRPDFAVNALLSGRFVIIIDGNPLALIGPATFALVLKSPEDMHFGFLYVSFVRLIRLFSFWMSILLPGLWVALTAYHQDQIPFQLMATIASSRQGLPFNAQLEMFILLLLLEIFREAGVRLPTSIGQTLTVIGALVIGDAAIRAGLVSPSVVIVGSITAVMGVTLVNQSLSSVVSVLRFFIFLISSFFGMYGLILAMLLLLFYMSRIKSFGVPYLVPISPPNFKDILKSYLRLPWSKMRKRPGSLDPIDPDHQKEDGQ